MLLAAVSGGERLSGRLRGLPHLPLPRPARVCAAAFQGMNGVCRAPAASWGPGNRGASLAGRIRLRHEIGRGVLGHAVNRRAEHGVPIVVIVRQV